MKGKSTENNVIIAPSTLGAPEYSAQELANLLLKLTADGETRPLVVFSGGRYQTWNGSGFVGIKQLYSETAKNTNGGTINAAFGSPLECIPSAGTLELVAPVTSDKYVIFGKINIGTDLNKDNGAIELMYGIDTGGGAVIGPVPYSQNGQYKKKKANGIQGSWGNVSLNAGDKVVLFLSTLGDSTTWTEGELTIWTVE